MTSQKPQVTSLALNASNDQPETTSDAFSYFKTLWKDSVTDCREKQKNTQ